ncbi:hypothetical protein [Nocardia otitidiscaviarum]|uniref:hypothetical protein n=1 Tax=Nocardia otitidiscaviarum TaxID=1823 RepID=UPI00245821D9|nr:hypothetical protein [Nocardia otitidiscaviarum]
MTGGLVTVTHVLAYCTDCGTPWRCGAVSCEQDACCLGDSDEAAVERLDASGWEVDLTRHAFRCRDCRVIGPCDVCGHDFGGGGVVCDSCDPIAYEMRQR